MKHQGKKSKYLFGNTSRKLLCCKALILCSFFFSEWTWWQANFLLDNKPKLWKSLTLLKLTWVLCLFTSNGRKTSPPFQDFFWSSCCLVVMISLVFYERSDTQLDRAFKCLPNHHDNTNSEDLFPEFFRRSLKYFTEKKTKEVYDKTVVVLNLL